MQPFRIYIGDKLLFTQGGLIITDGSVPQGGLIPNVDYYLGVISSDISITFAVPENLFLENEWKIRFLYMGGTITWGDEALLWNNKTKNPPVFVAGKVYEISVKNQLVTCVEYN